MRILLIAAVGSLAACSGPTLTNNSSAAAPNTVEEVPMSEGDAVATADGAVADTGYVGRWIGVEGTYLTVAEKAGGGVTLDMQWDLDHKGRFDGSITPEGLRFERDGVQQTATRTDGDATGLKYLAGKTDCLTVKPGEGYCRD